VIEELLAQATWPLRSGPGREQRPIAQMLARSPWRYRRWSLIAGRFAWGGEVRFRATCCGASAGCGLSDLRPNVR